jgi:hypothetical protein
LAKPVINKWLILHLVNGTSIALHLVLIGIPIKMFGDIFWWLSKQSDPYGSP